jgi:RNA polymerase sigma factor (sigma-70 family)
MTPPPHPATNYERFYDHYRNFVLFRLQECSYPGDVQDGVQQTFLKFWRNQDSYRPNKSGEWTSLLAVIADRVAMDATRKAHMRDRTLDTEAHDKVDPTYDTTHTVLSRERTRLLKKLLVKLPPHERMALLARTVNQVEAKEIWGSGDKLDKRGRANWRVYSYRAARKLREAILADPVTYGPLIPYIPKGDTTDDPLTPRTRVPVPAEPAGWSHRFGGYDPARR